MQSQITILSIGISLAFLVLIFSFSTNEIIFFISLLVALIIYRTWRRLPIYPRIPQQALFSEAWVSGGSMKGLSVQHGLLVSLTHDRLTITPIFPLNLIDIPPFCLEHNILLKDIFRAELKKNSICNWVELAWTTPKGKPSEFKLFLKSPERFLEILSSPAS